MGPATSGRTPASCKSGLSEKKVYRCGEATSFAALRRLSSLFSVAASFSGGPTGCQQHVEVG